MNVKETFLKLTERTYPHGTEQDLFPLLPSNLNTDEFGNLFIQIGESPSTMFTSHLDTQSSTTQNVNHMFLDGGKIVTDGSSILGADDKAGVCVLLSMIESNIPGLYYFFLGEERGCVGSRKLAEKHRKEPMSNIKKVISFDRRGTNSVITHQMTGRCCSDTFAKELANKLNTANSTFKYVCDNTGVYTDSAQFTRIYPECTNISVGYNFEHTSYEEQDIIHLTKLCEAVTKIDWDSLPIERDPSKITTYGEYSYDDDEEYYFSRRSVGYTYTGYSSNTSWTRDLYFEDPEYPIEQVKIELNKYTNNLVSIGLCQERLDYELDLIVELLSMLEIEYDEIKWDGNKLIVNYKEGNVTRTSRNELIDYIPILDFWKTLVKNKEKQIII